MQRYELTLQNEKVKTYRIISRLLILFNAIGIIYFLASRIITFQTAIAPIVALVATFFYFISILTEFIAKKKSSDSMHRFIFYLYIMSWIGYGFWWIGLLIGVFAILDMLAYRKLNVIVSDQFIQLPSVPKRIVRWNELNNAILKDGIITIDFKNNKLFQHPILNSDWDVDEESFNKFCKQCLAASDK